MSWLPNPIACDVCGAIKQPSNHWYYANIHRPVFYLRSWDKAAEDPTVPDMIHLCGQACAARKLNEFMSPPPPPNRQEPSAEARIQQQENREPAQPQWTEEFYTPDRRPTDPQ